MDARQAESGKLPTADAILTSDEELAEAIAHFERALAQGDAPGASRKEYEAHLSAARAEQEKRRA